MNQQNRPVPPPPIIVAPPIQTQRVQSYQSRPQLIEKTSKKYKAWMLLGMFGMMMGGIAVVVAAVFTSNGNIPESLGAVMAICGLLAVLAGIIVFFAAGLLAWWQTG